MLFCSSNSLCILHCLLQQFPLTHCIPDDSFTDCENVVGQGDRASFRLLC